MAGNSYTTDGPGPQEIPNSERHPLRSSLANQPSDNFGPQEAHHHDVIIKFVANGYIAQVGCQGFVFGEFDDLIRALRLYDSDPVAAEKTYIKRRR